MSVLPSLDGVFIFERTDIQSPNEVKISVAEMDRIIRRMPASEVRTSVAEINCAIRR